MEKSDKEKSFENQYCMLKEEHDQLMNKYNKLGQQYEQITEELSKAYKELEEKGYYINKLEQECSSRNNGNLERGIIKLIETFGK